MKRIKTIRINSIFILAVVFIFLCFIFKLIWIGTGNVIVNGKELSQFADDRDTVKRVTRAPRGTIYSADKEILAKKECVSLKDLAISGSDLIAAGMQPGKQIGVILNGLLEMVIEEPSLNTKEKLLELKELNF